MDSAQGRPPLLETRALTVVRERRRLVEEVSIRVEAGRVLALLGPNGAGKSTLMKALAGILPSEGELLLDGQPARHLNRRERARRVAYVPQHSVLDAAMLAREVVAQGRFAYRDGWGRPSADDASAIAAALETTGALALAGRPFTRLSYGERRLVLLARALATGAPVLLLDEPTAALDVAHALSLLHRLRELAERGHAVIVALHHLDEAAEHCTQAILLREGRVVRAGTVSQVVAAEPIREVFGIDLLPGASFGYRLANGTRPAGKP
jgi:iron complex transport system ATP-binding protein